ncbi:MAG: sodium:proton antiporter, partial [Bacteroidota bacterium]
MAAPVELKAENKTAISSTEVAKQHGDSISGDQHGETSGEAHHMPAVWSIIPFVILLLMIATGPLFYEHFWHKNYPIIAIILAAIIVSYYLFGLHNQHGPVHAMAEYVQFIALLAGLYIASGGIMIQVDKDAKPATNVAILLIGAVIANVIGTTGASMLLIRPFIWLNPVFVEPYEWS